MSISRMVSDEHYEKDPTDITPISDYPGWNTGKVSHSYNCPHYDNRTVEKFTDECNKFCRLVGPLYMHETHKGVVLGIREANYYDDSDFYAIVWDEKVQEVREIQYATTRAWTYPNTASVDATECVRREAELYYVRQSVTAWARKCYGYCTNLRKGRSAKVHSGKHRGKAGEIFWIGPAKWGINKTRCGISVAGETVWVSSEELAVLNPIQYMEDTGQYKHKPRFTTEELPTHLYHKAIKDGMQNAIDGAGNNESDFYKKLMELGNAKIGDEVSCGVSVA